MNKSLWQDVFSDSELTKQYFDLCSSPDMEGHTENHHILPKSIWPEYEHSDWNLVSLSPYNHYKAHELLPQICSCKVARRKMLDAWWFISHIKGVKVDAETYAKLRTEYVELSTPRIFTDEVRAKLSAAKKGKRPNNADKPKSDETRRKMSEAHKGEKHHFYGKKHTEESKAKISATKKGVGLSEETKQRMRDSYKRGDRKPKPPISEETREKMRQAKLGKRASEETKENMSKARLGIPLPEGVKSKLQFVKIAEAKLKSPRLLCVETGVVFDSVRDAAEFVLTEREVKIHNVISCISDICRGKVGFRGKVRASAYGYHWRYLTIS